MILLVCVVLAAIIKYQIRLRKHLQEVSNLKISYQEELFKAQLEVQEQTLHYVSEEIHDNIGQILSLVRLNLSTIKILEVQNSPKIQSSKQLLDQAIEDLRSLSKRLNSNYVSQKTLSESLKLQVNYIEKTGAFLATFETSGEEPTISSDIKLIIFRIAQEAINNALKHSKATHITVVITYSDCQIVVSINDNGKGFLINTQENSDNYITGVGMQSMQHRAKLIGAKLLVESKIDQGSQVKLIYHSPI
ncbi:sensor histidine kinase [Spirosoma sp. KCTC 42546]|uniref:sensor histidine kinase n=1 Tax=Spirosoma sp. KCTC 42546 TaxID=2520506 RepID=UPI00143D41EE|nr:ATP-binding protein [Spirosoma sp. KCTC 42546]